MKTSKHRQQRTGKPGRAVEGVEPGRGGVCGKTPLASGTSERQQAAKGGGATTKGLSIFRAVRVNLDDLK
jgi:hypothetical protein